MNFISIDIETTGLNPNNSQILEFGAVVVNNWKIVGTFEKKIYREKIFGEPFALSMNHKLIKEIANAKQSEAEAWENNLVYEEDLADCFYQYLRLYKHYDVEERTPIQFVAAGKNFGPFDLQFLKRIDNWDSKFKVHHRILDPAILYYDSNYDKTCLPNFELCKKRSGLFPNDEVKHRALKDAEDVAALIIHKLKQ